MDLFFKRKLYNPPAEFRGNLTEENFKKLFGKSTTFIITLKMRKSLKGDTNSYGFTFDTGAFLSYAPEFLLEDLGIKHEFKGFIRGAAPQEECKVKVKVAKINFKIIDDNGIESKELTAWFAFHPFDRGPFLLGMKDILEHWGVIKNVDQNSLILQIKE